MIMTARIAWVLYILSLIDNQHFACRSLIYSLYFKMLCLALDIPPSKTIFATHLQKINFLNIFAWV